MMNYNTFAKTDIKVSEVGIGCEHLQGLDYQSIKQVIDAAIDCGISIFDVFMPEPDVRSNIGRALAGRREHIILQGHIGAAYIDGQYTRTRNPEICKYFLEDFLERFQTDYVDIGMIHFIDDDKDFETVFNGKVIEYALHLKKKGIIRALGISSHNPVVALRAVSTGLLDVLMFSINPAYDILLPNENIEVIFNPETYNNEEVRGIDPIRAELYKTCEATGVAITVMKGLGAGALLKEETSHVGAALTPVQCIHYALTRPAVASVLVGVRTPDEVFSAAAYESATVDEKDFSIVLSSTPKFSFSGKCMYCNHCLPCPSKIDIALVNKYLDLAMNGSEVPDTVKMHYNSMENSASACIKCGNCERNCPFGVRVIERMQRAKEVFEVL